MHWENFSAWETLAEVLLPGEVSAAELVAPLLLEPLAWC
jgi:hypothetical protein